MPNKFLSTIALIIGMLTACEHDSLTPTQAHQPVVGAARSNVTIAALEPTQVRGMNFLIKSQVDNNFCINVENGGTEGRSVTLQTCSLSDFQRWAFPINSDDTNPIVEIEGMCINGRSVRPNSGLAVTVGKCGTGDEWHFVFTLSGHIQNVKNRKCLQVAGAVGGANVSLADCDDSNLNQLWTIAK